MKWVEVEPLEQQNEVKCKNLLLKNIICRFGLPHTVVTDNGKQFDNPKFIALCEQFGIKKVFSSPGHPQSNGQVEAANKTIKKNLKKNFKMHKGLRLMNYLEYSEPTGRLSTQPPEKPLSLWHSG